MRRAAVLLLLVLAAAGLWALRPESPAGAPREEGSRPSTPAVRVGSAASAARDRSRARAVATVDAAADLRPDPGPADVLRVTVRREDGTPVAGAHVALLTGPSRARPLSACGEVAAATTDAAGVATFSRALDADVVHAWTETAAGLAPLGEGDRTCSVLVRGTARCVVEVVDGDGAPVRGATVVLLARTLGSSQASLVDRAGARHPTPRAARLATTDDAGRVDLPPFPDGHFPRRGPAFAESRRFPPQVLVEAPGFCSAYREVDGPTTRVELVRAVEVHALVRDAAGGAISEPEWQSAPSGRGHGDETGRLLALVPTSGAPLRTLRIDAGGFLPRTFDLGAAPGDVVDLGTVVLDRAQMLAGRVVWPDGNAAAGVMVGAEGADGWHAEWITEADGGFALEPPQEGVFRVRAWAEGAPLRGSHRPQFFEGVVEGARPGSVSSVALAYVPAVLVHLVRPDPPPPGFSLDNVVLSARSADGREEDDFLPDHDRSMRLVRLHGRGPWTLRARHGELEPVDLELGLVTQAPGDEVPVRRVELRAARAR